MTRPRPGHPRISRSPRLQPRRSRRARSGQARVRAGRSGSSGPRAHAPRGRRAEQLDPGRRLMTQLHLAFDPGAQPADQQRGFLLGTDDVQLAHVGDTGPEPRDRATPAKRSRPDDVRDCALEVLGERRVAAGRVGHSRESTTSRRSRRRAARTSSRRSRLPRQRRNAGRSGSRSGRTMLAGAWERRPCRCSSITSSTRSSPAP